MPFTILAALSSWLSVLFPPNMALHVSEGVDQAADAVDGRTDLASYVAEAVGQGVGTVGQLVEIT